MDFRKHHFILQTVKSLREEGSWTGKTHVQKSLFLIEALTSVDVPFAFVLYMHGPYSFEIEEEMAQMRSYNALAIDPTPEYGVSISPGQMATYVEKHSSMTPGESDAIIRVCRFVGRKGVAELEKLATAAWIWKNEGITAPEAVASRLSQLKPHIPAPDAKAAFLELQTSGLLIA